MDLPKDLSPALLLSGSILVVVNSAASFIRSLPQKLWHSFLSRFSVTLEVPQNVVPFDWIRKLATEQRPLFGLRRFSTMWGGDEWVLTPAPGRICFRYRGKFGIVGRSRRELQGGDSFPIFETIEVRFFFADRRFMEQFLEDARQTNKLRKLGEDFYTYNSFGWANQGQYRFRKADTIVAADGVVESLMGTIGDFFGKGNWYADRGIPHRLGILLEGPPGNGKTSLIKAAVAEHALGLATISLTQDKLDDVKLLEAFTTLPARCVAIEDIDCVFGGRDGDGGVTFSGLLNAIDGVGSKDGYVLILTTNHPERLDPALIRPGRVDLRIHVGNVVREQASRYFARFYGDAGKMLADDFGDLFVDREISMARVQNVLMQHRDDPRAGHDAMRRYIQAAGGL